MKLRNVLFATALLALPVAAKAQPVTSWYTSPAVGINQLFNQNSTGTPEVKITNHTGFVASGGIGYGFGNGFRVELQGNLRYNTASGRGGLGVGGDVYQFGPMINGLYDFNIGLPWIYPYVGIGLGGQSEKISVRGYSEKSDFMGAGQGIVGAAWPVAPRWAVTTELRVLGGFSEPKLNHQDVTKPLNLSGTIGLRFNFGAPEPQPPAPAPAPVAAPAPAPARTYLVFFDWDKADLTARARQIIADAAQASTAVATTQIEVDGHADLSGTPQYNQGLSMRRAQAVGAELVRDGVPQNIIMVQAFGDTHPLVPTARGVREPQNRRVEIVLK